MPKPSQAAVLLVAGLALLAGESLRAAETEMVGFVALALESKAAEHVGLSDEQQRQLQDLVDRRERKGMSRAMRLANLPRDERIAEWADFRAESEREAMAILSEDQAQKLRDLASGRDDAALQASAVTAAEPPERRPAATPDEASETTPEPPSGADSRSDGTERPRPRSQLPSSSQSASPSAAADDGKLSFNFNQQPWGDVIRWFADHADLSVVVDQAPPGSLNYRDDRRYTAAEALDVLNGVLLTKGYTLVRKGRMLLVIDLEQDEIPPNVVTDITLSDLDRRGEYELVRVLVELGEIDPTAAADSLLRLTGPQGNVVVLPEARMLQVTETAGRIRTMLSVIEAMQRAAAPLTAASAELRSYPTGGADAETTLSVLQTLLEGSSTARLAIDDATGSLIALATPGEHAAIQQTLEKLQTDGRRVEVIPVREVDPLTAAALVDKLFNPTTGDDKSRDPNAPVVEADRYTDTLLVRGTADQVRQVRELVSRLDAPTPSSAPGARGPVRTLSVSGAEMQRALEQLETLWPTFRNNPLRVTNPAGTIPSFRPGADVERAQQERDPLDMLYEEPSDRTTSNDDSTRDDWSPFRLVAQPGDDQAPADEPIIITPGVGGTVIASRDTEALDALENLLAMLVNDSESGGRQYAVFYLKFSEATTAAALLNGIFGGDAGGGSLMGDLAGAAVGGGDLIGDLLGGGGSGAGGFSSVSVDVIPDVRLNALYVYATPRDLQTVNQLLRVIDQPRGPDRIESVGVARLIPVYNTDVNEVAEVVRQVFADRLGGGGGGGAPNPRELLRALQGGQKGADEQEPETMTIGVDERSQSLVVKSSEPLYEEVRTLVEQLDQAGVERPVATRVVSLRNTSSVALRETLNSLLGDKAVVAGAEGDTQQQEDSRSSADNQRRRDERQQRRNFRRQMEGIRDMQRMMERFNRDGGGGRGGRGGGPPGGGGRGGGR